jgi:hypothetical protein
MQGMKFRLKFGILPLENADPLIPGFSLAIKTIDDPQMFLVYFLAPPVLLQDPLGGHSIQIGAAVPVQAFKIMGWIGKTRHAYLFSKFRISQLILESVWISVQSLW